MNAGAAACTADLLLFLHADTRLPADADRLVQRATSSGHHWGRFDVAIDSPQRVMRIVEALMNGRSRWTGIATGDQALFVRRQIFEQIGGFTDMPLMEDIDFSRRLKRKGALAPLTTTVTTSFRRWEQHGPLRTILLMWALRFLYWIGVGSYRLAKLYTIVR